VRDDQASVALDTGRYNATLMRERVSRSHSFDRAVLEKGVIAGCADGFNTPICDGIDRVCIGSRGNAFFIVVKLQRALARCQAVVELKSWLSGNIY
jgi:hypothetical protein